MKLIFAVAIYVGCGGVWSNAMVNPTLDNMVAAAIAAFAAFTMMERRITVDEINDAKKALVAARKQLADQNMLLRAMREAVDANDLEPIKAYWRARGH